MRVKHKYTKLPGSTAETPDGDQNEKPSRGLSPDEDAILARQLYGLQDHTKNVGLVAILAYATQRDIAVLVLSLVTAIGAGAANPLLVVIFGQLAGIFTGFANGSVSEATLRSDVNQFALYYVYLAIVEFILIYISNVGFYWSGERIVRCLRRAYLEAILRQNVGFFDTLGVGQVTTHITSDMNSIQEALTSKLSLALTAASNFISAFAIAFIISPKLALILCSILVAMLAVTSTGTRFALKNDKTSKQFYTTASNTAQDAISAIRHVTAYGSQKQLADKYVGLLRGAEKYGIKSRIYVALLVGWSNAMPCFAYALGWYAGGLDLSRGTTTVAAVVSTTVAIVNGSFAMVRIIPTIENFVSGITSASATFEIIERESPQDPFSHTGIVPASIEANIDLKGIEVIYPSRKDTKILKGVDLFIPAMKTTALVGLSGSGKSTIFSLLQRFYEPTAGSIRLDGQELQDLNLKWLRSQMAYVGQEPTLFDTTIFENISHGLVNVEVSKTSRAIMDRVVAAAKLAHAHDFISSLPDGYHTEIGEKGISLSGGQRQRIAIARAVISDPKILLLDEATSALDAGSEELVQQALEGVSKNRTTITIAHRLSTIRNADNIIVMQSGEVMEQGTHHMLLASGGIYADLIQKQQVMDSISYPGHAGPIGQYGEKIQGQIRGSDDASTCAFPNDGEDVAEDSALMMEVKTHLAMDKEPRPTLWLAIHFILKLNRPEKWLLMGGLHTAFLAGFSLILQAVWFAEVLDSFSLTDPAIMVRQVSFWALLFAGTGVYAFTVSFANGVFFAFSTERLACRVRETTLRSILRQNIGYFDEQGHSTGQMIGKLATCTSDLAGLGGVVVGSFLTFVATMAINLGLCVAIGWKLTLFCTIIVPLVAGLGWIRMEVASVFDGKIRLGGRRAAAYASDAIGAIRTVAAGSLETYVLDRYRTIQTEQAAESLPAILRTSALVAGAQGLNFLAAGLVFWYGSGLLASGEYTLKQYYICFVGLVWGSQIAGTLFNFAPDISKAGHAAGELQQLFERAPDIDSWNQRGQRVLKEHCTGYLQLKDVSFVYPTRPNTTVLYNIDLDIPAGAFVALVGASGSGKSTILALLERFYEPSHGKIMLDGQDITSLNINAYRQMLSLVSQEPTIYSGTIRDNLNIGMDSEPGAISEARIIAACKDANIYSFITSLPLGFDTMVGPGGSMLSGGQKQRLALARAMLRAAPILLLDEATAALDSESEQLVQEALNATSHGRTTVAIAHRLSTIQHADIIYVFDKGTVVEKGSHSELMKMRGIYCNLVRIQEL